MRILAVSAHPDDLELQCGGTLIRYVREGHEVSMCNIANGNGGSFVNTRDEIASIRLQEAQRGAATIGATHYTLDFPDTELNAGDVAQRLAVVGLIRRVRPDVIITHGPNDYMVDHVETGKLVEDSSFSATVPLLETDLPALETVPAIYFMDNAGGLGFEPTEYVDISDVLDLKLEALAHHASQIDWLRDHDGADIIEDARVASLYRGYQCGVKAAEGFRPSTKYLRMRPARLLP